MDFPRPADEFANYALTEHFLPGAGQVELSQTAMRSRVRA